MAHRDFDGKRRNGDLPLTKAGGLPRVSGGPQGARHKAIQGGGEMAVLLGFLARPTDLAKDFDFARDKGVQPGSHAKEMVDGLVADVEAERQGRKVIPAVLLDLLAR
jgi:hypothetical protein